MKHNKISSSAPGLSVMTPRECRVDHPFPVTWLGNVWEPSPPPLLQAWADYFFFFFVCFWWTSGSFFVILSSVAPHRGQPAAMCHPRWQPTSRLADSCGLGRRWIQTRDCRTTGLFNPPFPGLKIRYRYAVTWTCDWHICNLITIDTTPLNNCKFRA